MYLIKYFRGTIVYVDNENTINISNRFGNYEKKFEHEIIYFCLHAVDYDVHGTDMYGMDVSILCDNKKVYNIFKSASKYTKDNCRIEEYDLNMRNVKIINNSITNDRMIMLLHLREHYSVTPKKNEYDNYIPRINLLDYFREDEIVNMKINHDLGIISMESKFIIFDKKTNKFEKYEMPFNEEYIWTTYYVNPNNDRGCLVTINDNMISIYTLNKKNIIEKKRDIECNFEGNVKMLNSCQKILINDIKKILLIDTYKMKICSSLILDENINENIDEMLGFSYTKLFCYDATVGMDDGFEIIYAIKSGNYQKDTYEYDRLNKKIKFKSSKEYEVKNGIKYMCNKMSKQKSARNIVR